MYIDKYSTGELEAELERRKAGAHPLPKNLQEIDWSSVHDLTMRLVGGLKKGIRMKEPGQRIFDAVLEVVYGPDIFDWLESHGGDDENSD